MAMSGAERQRRCRERHGHDLAHLTIDVHVDVRDRLDRLAWHYDCCLTELVERLAAAAEKHVEASLSGQALQRYRSGDENDGLDSAYGVAGLPHVTFGLQYLR